ncbi:MAG: SUMF1/EgtB/PvdO family nonheme iron enzyme [Puniceicoccales bacterium]|jgi:tetratricopeptide (TPR) repeat protein|nr:SUMF1/EgtB/PvdO family nonheme iron enzyme [Puniceicoccales bacterium]
MPSHPRRHSGKTLLVLQIIAVFVLAVAMLAAAYWRARQNGPLPTSRVAAMRGQDDYLQEKREIEEMRVKSREMWDRFVNVSEFRPKLLPEDIRLLEEAWMLREEYVLRNGQRGDYEMVNDGGTQKSVIEVIREKLHTIKAKEARARSEAEEIEANRLLEAGKFDEARKTYEKAIQFETEIKEKFPYSKMKDAMRDTHLDRRLKICIARPVWDAAQKLEKEADALLAKGEWKRAAEIYADVIEKEEFLRSTKYNDLFPSEYSRPVKLDEKRQTALAFPEDKRLSDEIERARKLAATGSNEEARKTWDAALAGYADLAKTYPRCAFTEPAPEKARRDEHDKTLMRPLAAEFAKRAAALDTALREGRADGAGGAAALILREADTAQKRYPAAFALDGTTYAKLRYIEMKAPDIATVHRLLAGFLLPVPGAPALRLMRCEVPQHFYALVMEGANPSAARGDLLPVDSVALPEAVEFCRRLGWLTGKNIRLPSADEFRLAVGGTAAARTAQAIQAWSFETSGGRAHEVATSRPNEHGFCDLLGNLAEWTRDDVLAADGTEIGGNYQNNRETLASVPTNSVPRRDKSRLRGFRILADDTPETPPPAASK